jgi:hypothetical protein
MRLGQVGVLVSLIIGCLAVHALTVMEGTRIAHCRRQQTALTAQAQGLRAAIEQRLSSLLLNARFDGHHVLSPTLFTLTLRKANSQVAASRPSVEPFPTTLVGEGRGRP